MLPSSVKNLSCSFSGVETKAANALKNGEKHGTVAAAVYDCIARTLAKLVKMQSNSKRKMQQEKYPWIQNAE